MRPGQSLKPSLVVPAKKGEPGMPGKAPVEAELRVSYKKAVCMPGVAGKPDQPTWSSQAGAGGQEHQHTEATQDCNPGVGWEGDGGSRRLEQDAVRVGLGQGG